jgi:hypothetical protein
MARSPSIRKGTVKVRKHLPTHLVAQRVIESRKRYRRVRAKRQAARELD